MCQQHTRTYTCGHHEALKPRYCPLVVQNGGQACENMDIIDRATSDLCPRCQAEQQVKGPSVNGMQRMDDFSGLQMRMPQVPVVGVQDVVMGGT